LEKLKKMLEQQWGYGPVLIAVIALALVALVRRIRHQPRRRLLVLDMNNVLVYRAYAPGLDEPDKDPRIKDLLNSAVLLGKHYTWKRPGLDEFVDYCLCNFDVAVWSSAQRENVDRLCEFVFGARRRKLVFEWDQSKCEVAVGPRTFLKPYDAITSHFPTRWQPGDIMIVDDSIEKVGKNPVGSYLIASAWTPLETDRRITRGLMPGSELRIKLEEF
jgi:hypothetical protein